LLREGMAETLTVIRLGIRGKLRRTLDSTNPAESMIDTPLTTHRNVKHGSSGEIGLRWTAAGMLEAEKPPRNMIGYTDLPRLAIAIQRRLHLPQPTPPHAGGRSQSLCNDHIRTVLTEAPRRPGQPRSAWSTYAKALPRGPSIRGSARER
jgi:hypothetical protein